MDISLFIDIGGFNKRKLIDKLAFILKILTFYEL